MTENDISIAEQIANLKSELAAARRERDDWQWAYQLTEGILKADRKWHGVNERFSDQSPIVAAKLAKELMGRKRPTNTNPAVPQVVVPDYYRDLVEWISRGLWRRVTYRKPFWAVRDEASSREINGSSLEEILKSEAWVKFKAVR